MSFAGTELLRVTVENFSISESSTDNSFPNASKAMPSREENKRQFVCSRHHHEGDTANTFGNQTQQCLLDRYATQAPHPIIKRDIACETTEKDSW